MTEFNIKLKAGYYDKYLIQIQRKIKNKWSLHGLHHRKLNHFIQKSIFKLPSQSSVLDAGCGLSIWLTPEIEKKIKYLGIDCQIESIEFCRKYFPSRDYSLEDLYQLPFHDNSFDAVIMREVIEHLESPDKVVREVVRILKPTGILILTTPNYGNPLLYIIEHTYNRFFGGPCKPYLPDVHPTRFKYNSLLHLLKRYFDEVEIKTISLRLNIGAIAKSVKKDVTNE